MVLCVLCFGLDPHSTMGEWLEYVLVEPRYYSTLMTRIPVLIARMLKVKVRYSKFHIPAGCGACCGTVFQIATGCGGRRRG